MRVLLVSPPVDAPLKELVFDPVPVHAPFPPLGILYVSAALKKAGHTVFVFDGTFQKDLSTYIKGKHVDVAGVYATVLHYSNLLKVCRTLKEHNIPVVVGGPLPSCYPDLILCDDIDFLVRGEGEKSLVHLIEHMSAPQTVPNVVWKKNGRIIKNPVTMITDIDSIPFPDRENFIFDTYMGVWQTHFQFTCTSVLSSRGCPYQCTFCDKSVFGFTYRARSVENIIPEIVYLDERGVEKIWFADDLFTLDKKRVLALCHHMKKEGLDLEWYCESRVDTIDKEMLETMKKAGCTWIGFGVESGNADILTYMRKGHTIQTVEKAFTITKEVGINRCAYFILGLPRDTPETVKDTLQFAMKIDPDSVEFSLPIPIPGTALWEEVQTVHESFDFFDNRSFLVFDHPHFSKSAAETMIQDAYTQFLQFKRKTNPDFTLEDQW